MTDKAPRFITKLWIEKHGQSRRSYSINKKIRFQTSMLKSDLCDYNQAYIAVEGTIFVRRSNNDAYDRKLAFKNNAPFISCTSKINNTLLITKQVLQEN